MKRKDQWTWRELQDLANEGCGKQKGLLSYAISSISDLIWASSPATSTLSSDVEILEEAPSDAEFLSRVVPFLAGFIVFSESVETVMCLAEVQLKAAISEQVALIASRLNDAELQKYETSLQQLTRDRGMRDTEIRNQFLAAICNSYTKDHDK